MLDDITGTTQITTNDTNDTNASTRQLWNALLADLRNHTHSNLCFRALIIMYLFHPSNCLESYYGEVLPVWMKCWRGVDRCSEWDYLGRAIFVRVFVCLCVLCVCGGVCKLEGAAEYWVTLATVFYK